MASVFNKKLLKNMYTRGPTTSRTRTIMPGSAMSRANLFWLASRVMMLSVLAMPISRPTVREARPPLPRRRPAPLGN